MRRRQAIATATGSIKPKAQGVENQRPVLSDPRQRVPHAAPVCSGVENEGAARPAPPLSTIPSVTRIAIAFCTVGVPRRTFRELPLGRQRVARVDQAERDSAAKLIGDILVSPDLPQPRVRSDRRFSAQVASPRVSMWLVHQ